MCTQDKGILTEHVSLGEGTKNGDLITKDLGWWPGNSSRAAVDTIDYELASTTNVVDSILENLSTSGSFNDNVEAIFVLILNLLELSFWVVTGKFDVDISSIKLLCEIHLKTTWCSEDNLASTILSEQLSENETSWSSTEHENG